MEYTKEEKHIPVITVAWNTVTVTVPNHPTQSEEHFISNISLFNWKGWDLLIEQMMTHEDAPTLEFEVESTENLYATEVCNLHWKWDSDWAFLGM